MVVKDDMHPVITVNRQFIKDGKSRKILYELILSRENFNHLCAGCPEMDSLIGDSQGGFYFRLFPSKTGEMSKSFRPLHDGRGYFACVGAPVPMLPAHPTSKEVERLAQQAYDNLEKAINESGKIPIEEESPLTSSGKSIIGYVVMKVEAVS